MSWAGYFIKATATGQIFPNEYIAWESYESEPNHREEIKAYSGLSSLGELKNGL